MHCIRILAVQTPGKCAASLASPLSKPKSCESSYDLRVAAVGGGPVSRCNLLVQVIRANELPEILVGQSRQIEERSTKGTELGQPLPHRILRSPLEHNPCSGNSLPAATSRCQDVQFVFVRVLASLKSCMVGFSITKIAPISYSHSRGTRRRPTCGNLGANHRTG